MAEEISQREIDKLYMASSIQWMQQAFAGHPGEVQDMINGMHRAFTRMVESYEEELECLKHALPADSDTQTTSLPAPVDSVAE